MRLFSCTNFNGFYPVGVAAIIWAESPEKATEQLNESLRNRGLEGNSNVVDMHEIHTEGQDPFVTILNDGNY